MANIKDRSRISVSPFGDPLTLNSVESQAGSSEPTMPDVNDRLRISVSPFGDPVIFDSTETQAVTGKLTVVDDEDIFMLDPSQSIGSASDTPIDLSESQEIFIDLTSDDETERAIDELTSDMAHITASAVDNVGSDRSLSGNSSSISNQSTSRSATPEPQFVVGGVSYKAGMSLELHDGSFMRITEVVSQPHDLRFSGRRLYRTTHPEAETYLPKVHNELVWLTQNTDNVSIKNVKRIVQITFTNVRTDFINIPPEQREKLNCRLKLTIHQNGVIPARGRMPLSSEQYAIEWLCFLDCDRGFGLPSYQLRDQWRGIGRTVYFGEGRMSSQAADLERQGVIDLTGSDQAYTFGDAYCGGGGVSCGAKQAGVKIKWAVDVDKHALDTYQLNFNDVEVEHSFFDQFLTNDPDFLRVDIAHCSPPCQTWSPAHTVPCPRDDANSACVFSAGSLIREARPRVLTLEETMGLPQRFPIIFNRVLLDMVEFGYSVRWSVLGCDDHGVPQERKRLVVIAAG